MLTEKLNDEHVGTEPDTEDQGYVYSHCDVGEPYFCYYSKHRFRDEYDAGFFDYVFEDEDGDVG